MDRIERVGYIILAIVTVLLVYDTAVKIEKGENA